MLQCVAVCCTGVFAKTHIEGKCEHAVCCKVLQCSVLQSAAVCCSLLQSVALECLQRPLLKKGVSMQCVAVCCSALCWCVAVEEGLLLTKGVQACRLLHYVVSACMLYCSVVQDAAGCCSMLQWKRVCYFSRESTSMQGVAACCSAVCCSVLQNIAVCCSGRGS